MIAQSGGQYMPRVIAAALICVVVFVHVMAAGQTRPPGDVQVAREALAPTGVLRAAFLRDNPVQGRVNPQTGEVTGLAADVTQRLAMVLGTRYQLIPSENAAAVIMNVNTGAADFGFLAYDAERTEQIDYAGNLAVMRSSYVVADSSPLRRSSDADRMGAVIGAVKGASQQLFLSSTLRQASLRVFDTQPAREVIERLLTTGELSAFAMNRQRALDLNAASPALRALPDSFVDIAQSFVVRKGDAIKRARLQRIAAEMRASGVVTASIRKAGLEDSTAVAPEGGN
jgi:polar amino acid transport system substrate-binding protein